MTAEVLPTDSPNQDLVELAPADPPALKGIDSAAGWLVVGATFLSTFAVFGVAYSFGAFFIAIREEFNVSNSEVALLFSITTFVYFMLGVLTGRLADRFGPRPVLLVGAVVMVAALLITSRVTQIWLGYITYGTGVGIGVACAYVPMVAAVGAWFNKRRTAALGVAVAGIGLGTLVGSPAAKIIIDDYGWRTGYVIIAIAAGGLLLLASFGSKRPPAPPNPEPLPRLGGLISNWRFVVLYAATIFISAALFVPFVYLDDYLENYGSDRGPLLIGLIGAASIIGRLGFGALGSVISLMRMFQLSFFMLAASFLIWLYADGDFSQLVIFTVVLGIGYGGFIALSPAVAAYMFGPIGLGGVLGALYTSAAFGGLLGPPLAGELIDRQGYSTTIETALWVALVSVPLLIMAEVLGRRHIKRTAAAVAGPAGAGLTSAGLGSAGPAGAGFANAGLGSAGSASTGLTSAGLTSAGQIAGLPNKIGEFDSVLMLSFGGPEGRDDVIPFLRNVTAGRDVPEQRLQAVAEQYLRHDGISPIGHHNRTLVGALHKTLNLRGFNAPVYLGNRNWHPFLAQTLAEMAANGHQKTVCVVTSAFSSYSGCRQYNEDIAAARAQVANAPDITRVRVFHNHPGFIGAMAERVKEALQGSQLSPRTPTIFTAHSLPLTMAAQCNYEAQLNDAAVAVAKLVGLTGTVEVAYQSRSGRLTTPWLEPDIGTRLAQLGGNGGESVSQQQNTGVLVVPLGFMADHMEVVHDLDTVARAVAAKNHLTMVRARSVGTHPLLLAALADLIEETAGLRHDRPSLGLLGAQPDQCELGCCSSGLAAAASGAAAWASKA